MSQPANDDFSQHLSDDEASYHEDASDNGTVTNKPKQQQRQLTPKTTTISIIKLPILKKEEYDIWAMEMEHYLKYIDNDVWKVIQNGNSKKRISTGKDGVVRVLPPVSAAEIHAVEKERKARTILIMAIPKDHLRRFYGMDDAKEIWEAKRARFGGNENLKKMQKAVLKQQFEAFTIFNSDRQELTSTSKSSASAQNVAFVSHSKSSNNKVKSGHTGPYSTYTPSTSSTIFQNEKFLLNTDDYVDIEEMDINWQIVNDCYSNEEFLLQRRLEGDSDWMEAKPVGFDKKKLECFKCHIQGTKMERKRLFLIKIKELERKAEIQTVVNNDDLFARICVSTRGALKKEERQNHALQAISSNNEVSINRTTCIDSIKRMLKNTV
ncbi:hypothetical protein Tco_0427654 [Tanacetum coccineum]